MEIKFTEIVSLAFSSIALFFTFRKDAHRISLEVNPMWEQFIDVIGVNNDSSFPVGVLSVGHINQDGDVTWVPVGDFVQNKSAPYPIRIEPRSLRTLHVMVVRLFNNQKSPHGYCVQLESGRIYVVQHTASLKTIFKFYVSSLLSRLSAGRYVPWLTPPRLPN